MRAHVLERIDILAAESGDVSVAEFERVQPARGIGKEIAASKLKFKERLIFILIWIRIDPPVDAKLDRFDQPRGRELLLIVDQDRATHERQLSPHRKLRHIWIKPHRGIRDIRRCLRKLLEVIEPGLSPVGVAEVDLKY